MVYQNKNELINAFKQLKNKNALRNGKPTKIFLKWNKQQLKDRETTIYYEDNVVYNLKTNRLINIQYDKRRRGGRVIKKSFQKKYIKYNSLITTRDPNKIEVTVRRGGVTGWNTEYYLENANLIRHIIEDKAISGNYRLIMVGFTSTGEKIRLINRSYDIVDKFQFWRENMNDFLFDSETWVWNRSGLEKVIFYFTKEKQMPYQYYQQSFRDGINHCFFQPIINHFEYIIEEAKTQKTKDNYQSKINIINGKQLKNTFKPGLIHKYKDGIPEKEISDVCELLQIGVDIEQPFNDKILFEYRSNKRALKVFKFINTRFNHIEKNETPFNKDSVFKDNDPIIVGKKELEVIKKELDNNGELCIYKLNNYGLTGIRTLNECYMLKNDFFDTINKFENDTGLSDCAIDSIKYPELQDFINSGTHYNQCLDLKNTDFMRDNKNIPDNMKHIDMTKAYTQFFNCDNYNGFMGKITDFREVDNYKQKGLYLIKGLDLSKCNEKFKMLNDKLKWFNDDNIYTDRELNKLEKLGGKFKVIYGAYGLNIDFRFEGDMLNKKDKIMLDDTELNIPYYSKYTGFISMDNKYKSLYMKGDKRFFSTIPETEGTTILYNNDLEEGKITYKKKYSYNKRHITAQITAYQRLIMLEQLMKMDINSIYRVCVDGIYYISHEFKKHKSFCKKEKMTFKNSATTEYLSNLNLNDMKINNERQFYSTLLKGKREFYKKELFCGAGGNGKTYHNLTDKGLINTVFVAHSWNLATEEQKKYKEKYNKYLPVTVHHRLFNTNGRPEILNKYNNYIIDEVSMLTENQKQYLFNKIKGKIILCGDIGYQIPPIEEGTEMTKKGFDNVIELTKNYRFKCDKLKKVIKQLRDDIKDKKELNIRDYEIQKIKREDMQYEKEDLILVSRHTVNDTYNEIYKDIEKYKITENLRTHKNGQIVYEKIKGVKCEFRHGYTIHSIQGRTHKKKLFIDLTKIRDLRMFYTAVSRAEYLDNIFLIV